MNVGDKCRYKSNHNNVGCWDNYGIILDIKGPYSARVYTIGVPETGKLLTKTSHYVMKVNK